MLVLLAAHELKRFTRVAQLVAAATFVDAWARSEVIEFASQGEQMKG